MTTSSEAPAAAPVDPVEFIEDRATGLLHSDESIRTFGDARMRALAAATAQERSQYFGTLLAAHAELRDLERDRRLDAMVAAAVAEAPRPKEPSAPKQDSQHEA